MAQKNPTHRSIQLHVLSALLAYCIGFTVKENNETRLLLEDLKTILLKFKELVIAKVLVVRERILWTFDKLTMKP